MIKARRERKAKSNTMRRSKLSVRIAFITILSSLFSILALEFIFVYMQGVVGDYEHVIDVDLKDEELMDSIMVDMHQHQGMVFEHMVESDKIARQIIMDDAAQVEKRLKDNMMTLGESVRGTDYEAVYHDIFSDMSTYVKNVKLVVDMTKEHKEQTANVYMVNELIPLVQDMDKQVEKLGDMIHNSVEEVKIKVKSDTDMMRIITYAVLLLLLLSSAFTVSYCIRISNEMISRDLLTGVANFDHLINVGEKLGKRNRLKNYSGLAISIKDFKFINQEYGSVVGDIVLKSYATALNEKLIRGELLCRNGGDNFIALVEKERVDSYLKEINKVPVDVGEKLGLTVTSRCGIYQIAEDDTIYDMVNAGLIAVGETRTSGAQDYVWFRRERRDEMIRRKDILNGYHRAIDEEEFVVYYQPKVNLRTRTLCGCEALVRWIRNGELVPPGSFIPVLENDGKVQELDFYVFDKVCRDISDWQRRGLQPVRVSSNFSKLHLHNKEFAEDVLAVVDKHGADPYYLETELTESSGYEDFNALTHFVSEMKEAGIHTSMDDFGTGYSSLSLLRDIDMDVIKLDRTFLRDQYDAKEEKMVENIVRMIHDLNRHVICEGVETEEQVEFLKRVGCTMAQGFLFDRPLSREDFEKRLINPYYD